MIISRSGIARIAPCLALLLLTVTTAAAPPAAAPPSGGDEQPGVDDNYARTPDAVVPFRQFHDPYRRFFETEVEFLGTGRDSEPATKPPTVRIGYLGPLDAAPDADLGQAMRNGVVLAIEQANATGGYGGTPFELVVRRDLGQWGATSNEMVSFRSKDDVLAVVGSIDGANTHVALRVALKTQMPMVNTATTDPTLTETRIPWLLRCMADDRQQGFALSHYLFTERDIEKVVAFRVNDRYGRTGIAEFRDVARRMRRPFLAELRWDRGDRDFTRQLDRIAEIGPEAIVLWGNAADTAAIVREIRRREMPVRIAGCDRLASRAFLEDAGAAAEGVVAAATFDPTRNDPKFRSFVDAYTRRFGEAPGTFAAHAYDGANIVIAAIHRAGLNRVRIRDALHEVTSYPGVTGPILFDTTHNDVGPVHLATVTEGRWVYREVDLASREVRQRRAAYRTLDESPPVARSPDRGDARPPTAPSIGCFLPLDGGGRAAVRGMTRAVAEDASRHPGVPVELLVRDSRGAWGTDSGGLADLVQTEGLLAVIASTERRGTHLAEMIAAKLHVPVVTMCGSDPSVTAIPLPWIFSVAPEEGRRARHDPSRLESLGYDAAAILIAGIRAGDDSRRRLRDRLAAVEWHEGKTGTFRFDALGRRVDQDAAASVRVERIELLGSTSQ